LRISKISSKRGFTLYPDILNRNDNSKRGVPETSGNAEPQLGRKKNNAELGLGVPRENMPHGYPTAG